MDENQASSDLLDLQAQFQSLRRQTQVILSLLILISGIFTLFLIKQNRDLNLVLNEVQANFDEFKNQAPFMDEVVTRLADFGRTHPEFAPIYKKYGLDKATAAPKK